MAWGNITNGNNSKAWLVQLKFFFNRYFTKQKKYSLPDFLIIGAQKSGTTALSYNLNQHPYIFMPIENGEIEIHYFDKDVLWKEKNIHWYMKHFVKPNCLQGEKTPEYLFSHKCHKRMQSILPNVKLIILLRNPVDRAYSQWNHFNQIYEQSKYWGWVKTDFENAIESNQGLLLRGEYINQINHLLKFYNKEQIYIGIAEKMKKNPKEEMKNIYTFLNIPHFYGEYKNRHVRSYNELMNPVTRKKLIAHYKTLNDRLFDLLGYKINEWGSD